MAQKMVVRTRNTLFSAKFILIIATNLFANPTANKTLKYFHYFYFLKCPKAYFRIDNSGLLPNLTPNL